MADAIEQLRVKNLLSAMNEIKTTQDLLLNLTNQYSQKNNKEVSNVTMQELFNNLNKQLEEINKEYKGTTT